MMEARDLECVIDAHQNHARKPENRYRKWDGKTPYSIHPIWCAATLLHETKLPEQMRRDGSLALLYHDVLEDTTAPLPDWLSQDVKGLVQALTFESSEDEWENIWSRGELPILLKLYDKTGLFLDGTWIAPKRREQHLAHLRKLCEYVERKHGELNITLFARVFLQ